MIKNKLQDGIIVKTKTGDFKILKNGQLETAINNEIIVPEDDLMVIDKIKTEELQVDLNKKKPLANFYIDVSDEHEVEQFKTKDQIEKNRAIKEYIEAKAVEIISHAGLGKIVNKNQQLRNIVISRIRDVRSLAETKEALKKLVEITNMYGDNDWINILIPLIEKDKVNITKIIQTGKIPKIIINKNIKEIKINKKTTSTNKESVNIPPKKISEVIERNNSSKNMVMGPIDEIKNISIADFRKLAKNPMEAADKVLQKIDLLEDESLIKKFKGIIAWRASEVYKLYLEIGAVSMAEKKTVEQVIREFREKGRVYLTPEEFNAMADLNIKLGY